MNLPIGSQKLSTGLAYITVILQKKMKKSKNIGFIFVGSFMEIASSFKNFEIIGTNGSFILEYLKNWNYFFFKKFKEPPNTNINF
jgi:hypothetical protein